MLKVKKHVHVELHKYYILWVNDYANLGSQEIAYDDSETKLQDMADRMNYLFKRAGNKDFEASVMECIQPVGEE